VGLVVLPALAALIVLVVPSPCRAGFISELYLSDGSSGGPSSAVEVTGLGDLTADSADLIVIDATYGRHGNIQRVITLPTAAGAHLVSETAWPAGQWGPGGPAGDTSTTLNRATLGDLDEGSSFELNWARTLLLYDRATGVKDDGSTNLYTDNQPSDFQNATLLDALTFTISGTPVDPAAAGPALQLAPGEAVVRPIDEQGALMAPPVGKPDADGQLAGVEPALRLTPGWENPVWQQEGQLPEPTTGAILSLALGAMALRRPRRHCSNRPGRL